MTQTKKSHAKKTLKKKPKTNQDILEFIIKKLDAGKADKIITINLTDKSPLTDYVVIATGTSSRHVMALVHNLADALKEKGIKSMGDGMLGDGSWVVLDLGDIIVHIFTDEARRRYALEEMWGA